MKKNYLILTDALTYNGIQEQIGQADLKLFRVSGLSQGSQNIIKQFLFDHWSEINEVHFYNEGTKVGFKWLTGESLENTEPNRVRAVYGQITAIITVNCSKGIDPGFLENWENGSCKLDLSLVQVGKPEYEFETPDEFLSGIE